MRGPEIDMVAAVARRQAGLDVVVCGNDLEANRSLAGQIEAALSPCKRTVEQLRPLL